MTMGYHCNVCALLNVFNVPLTGNFANKPAPFAEPGPGELAGSGPLKPGSIPSKL